MSNNPNFLNDMEFEKRLSEMGDNQPELIKFVARQQFSSSKTLTTHNSRIAILENGDRKMSGIVGGITGAITGIVIGVLNYLVHRG